MPRRDSVPPLQIRCKSSDTKIAFKILAARIDQNYEETLLQLLALEKEYPLQKKPKGRIERL